MVIRDNRGVMHRAIPDADGSGREMHRCTPKGDEPFQEP
jgi:alpha-ketoglutarate-dependent taurine dioxygenase